MKIILKRTYFMETDDSTIEKYNEYLEDCEACEEEPISLKEWIKEFITDIENDIWDYFTVTDEIENVDFYEV